MSTYVQLNPEVKLLRVLLRTDCDGVRKSMLQERLQLPDNDIFLVRLFCSMALSHLLTHLELYLMHMMETTSPRCKQIFYEYNLPFRGSYYIMGSSLDDVSSVSF